MTLNTLIMIRIINQTLLKINACLRCNRCISRRPWMSCQILEVIYCKVGLIKDSR